MNLVERESFVDPRLARPQPVSWRDWFAPKRGRTDWHKVARRLDYRPRIGGIGAPTLLLCGRHDPQYPPGCSDALLAAIPRARLAVFEQSGHYPFIEEPARFWREVAAFLEGGEVRPTAAPATSAGGPAA